MIESQQSLIPWNIPFRFETHDLLILIIIWWKIHVFRQNSFIWLKRMIFRWNPPDVIRFQSHTPRIVCCTNRIKRQATNQIPSHKLIALIFCTKAWNLIGNVIGVLCAINVCVCTFLQRIYQNRNWQKNQNDKRSEKNNNKNTSRRIRFRDCFVEIWSTKTKTFEMYID